MELLSDGRNVLLILLGFGLLIFVHELGHFMAARWAGIRCESFAVGMGPVVAAWRRGIGWRAGSTDPATIARHGKPAVEMSDEELARNGIGETEWSLRLLPLGGYVRMLGQEDLDPSKTSTARRSYQRTPVGKRMVVVSAGVVANLVLAVALFVVAFMVGVRFEAPVVGGVVPGSPAATAECAEGGEAGLRAGDRVVAIDGAPAQTFADLQIASAMARPGSPVELRVERTAADGASVRRTFRATPRRDAGSGLLSMGIAPAASGGLGVAAKGEEKLLARLLDEAGLAPERVDGVDDPLASLVGVGRPGEAGAIANPTQQVTDRVDDGEGPAGCALAPDLLGAAARASGGEAIRTQWMTRSGRTVERSLRPLPEYQALTIAAADGEPAESDLGLAGLVPLLRVDRLAPGSPNEGILLPGDVLLRVDGHDGPRLAQLRAALAPGAGRSGALGLLGGGDRTAQVTVLRDGKPVTLEARVDRQGRLGAMLEQAFDLPMVADPMRATPAAGLGALARSRVTSIEGTPVADWPSMRAALLEATRESAARGEGQPVAVAFASPTAGSPALEGTLALAADDVRALHALSWRSPVPDGLFEPLMTTLTAHGNPARAVQMGFHQTRTMVTMTYLTLDRLVRGSVGVDQLRGPVGIVHLGTRVADRGAMYLVFFLAMISVNLSVLNFLPLPIVDGGLFLYLVWERLTGRPPSMRFQSAATALGLVLLGSIFVLTFFNDVVRIVTGG
jgi:regulator of sigma E protease